MSHAVLQRFHHLAKSLQELKVRIRTILAGELSNAVGSAVRDVLVITLMERLLGRSKQSPKHPLILPQESDATTWDCDPWDDGGVPWEEDPDPVRMLTASEPSESIVPMVVPTTTAVTVGINVGRWWMERSGSVRNGVTLGLLTTTLGLIGGPLTRATLTVLAAAIDVLTAESALARPSND